MSHNLAYLRFLYHFSSQLALCLVAFSNLRCIYVTWSVANWRERPFLTLDVSCPKVITQDTTKTKSFESTLQANPAKNLQLVIPEETQHMYII